MFTKMLLTLLILSSNLISFTSCYLPELSRKLEKSGFHREISTTLEVPADLLADLKDSSETNCQVLFKEVIPSSAYVDPFQLAALKDFGGPPDYLLTDGVDVERPEYESGSFSIYVFENLTQAGDGWAATYSLPVHLRYHAVANNRDYTSVTFQSPEIALRCKDDGQGYRKMSVKPVSAPCDSTGLRMCEWMGIHFEEKSDELQTTIPVGRKSHYLMVTMGTIITTLLGCIVLGYNTAFSNSKNKVS